MQNKTQIQNQINKNNFRVKKQYGQNFLSDHSIVEKIAELSNITKDMVVVEIGPGLGSLTKELLDRSKKVIAFEIDTEIIPILKDNLKEYSNLEVVNEDILKTNVDKILEIKEECISVSNLPYYITSPIIDLFLNKMKNVKKGVYMVQKEVAERICASKGTKDYNAFSILVQYYAKCKKILNVPRTCFTPAPNVDSAVIELVKYDREYKPNNEELFVKVVESSFKERRKMLVNNLSSSLNISKDSIRNILIDLGINEDVRGEALSIDEFIDLTNEIERIYNGKNR